MQPARLEFLSSEPHIVLHHDVLTPKQADQLLELMDEEEEPSKTNRGASYQPMKFSKLAQKKLRSVYQRLGLRHEQSPWQGRRHGHGHATKLESNSEFGRGHAARGMLNVRGFWLARPA